MKKSPDIERERERETHKKNHKSVQEEMKQTSEISRVFCRNSEKVETDNGPGRSFLTKILYNASIARSTASRS